MPTSRRRTTLLFLPLQRISGSGAGAETILLTKTKKEILCERVVRTYILVRGVARPEVKEPEVPSGAFAYFCHCWERSERCQWQMKRGERVAAVKILAA